MKIKEKKDGTSNSWTLKHNVGLTPAELFGTDTIKHPTAIISDTITRKHPNVKLRSDSTHLNYVEY